MIDEKRFDYLLDESGPAAIVLKRWLKPVGGDIFFPPTYANPSQKKGDPAVYNIDRFGESSTLRRTFEKLGKIQAFIDAERTEHGKEHSVCIVDSIASQANRIEPAFARAINGGKLVPQIVIKAKIKEEGQETERTINVLEAGHRAADAIVRFSSLADEFSKAINLRKNGDSLPLAKIAPTSLIFGMWDSRATGVKVPRLMNSIIKAYDVLEYRRSAQFFPAIDFEAAGVVAEKGEKGLGKLSEEGMAEVPSSFTLGGIEARGGICQEASLNLVTLRDIVTVVRRKTGSNEQIDVNESREETTKLQRYILGLSLVAMTWFEGKALNLRQGCQLVCDPAKSMSRVLVKADGTESSFEVDLEAAVKYAGQVAEVFVVGHDREGIFDVKKAKAALNSRKEAHAQATE
jgi:CRISPR-associated protein Csb1